MSCCQVARPDTCALLHTRGLNSTCVMSLVGCGHSGNFLSLCFSEEFPCEITVASKTEYSVHLVFGLCFHSSTTMNVDHEELWLSPVWSARDELTGAHVFACNTRETHLHLKLYLRFPSESTQRVCEVRVWINCVTHEIVLKMASHLS